MLARMGILTAAALLGLAALTQATTPARAGILELLVDDTSRERYCDIEPCHHNDLEADTRYVKDRYLRYHIETTPSDYELRQIEVIDVPPKVVLHDRPGQYVWVDGKRMLIATAKAKVELEGAWTETVTARVLVRPARHRVIREQPHWAYYADRIVVQREGCGHSFFSMRC